SNPAVATVDANGLVTALKTGTATITATSASGNKATCKVTVKGITVKLNKTKASVVAESTLQLTATLAATSAEYSKVTWTSSNAAVATVSEAGLVTGVAPGTATITCTTQSGNKATCKVTVTPIKVTQITLENPHGTLAVGSAYALKATCEPANASNTALTWKSSSTKIATVDANGTVTALKSGTVTITATA
ncbi:MAG: Ig-like domain-containing protein, partial [Clostridia bacterium]|nr:Ig-like domain-containing protein [Clostridia bacterium]